MKEEKRKDKITLDQIEEACEIMCKYESDKSLLIETAKRFCKYPILYNSEIGYRFKEACEIINKINDSEK